MISTQLSWITQCALLGWLFGLMVLVAVQAFTGKILVSGILGEGGDSTFEVHRIQLLVITIGVAAGYFGTALSQGPGSPLPDIPTTVLVGLAGSHGVFLRGKHAAIRRRKGRER